MSRGVRIREREERGKKEREGRDNKNRRER